MIRYQKKYRNIKFSNSMCCSMFWQAGNDRATV